MTWGENSVENPEEKASVVTGAIASKNVLATRLGRLGSHPVPSDVLSWLTWRVLSTRVF
jgi:hypothetical protein